MKKSLSIILCAVMIALTFCSCKFVKSKDNRETEESTTTTTTTTTTTEATEEETKKSDKKSEGDEESITVFVTDKDGEVVTDKNGTPKTETLDIEKLQEQLEQEISNQASSKKTNPGSKTDDEDDDPLDIDSSKEDLLPEGSKADKTTLMKTVVEPILKSGTYTIKGNIKAGGQAIGSTIALRNGGKDYSATVSMGAIAVRVFSNNGKYYLALPTMGKYAEVSSDDIGDIGDLSESFKDKDAKYVQTTTVKSGAQKYTCEEYKTSSGTAKYYFNSKNEWKRMEIIDGEDILVWEITSFSKNADKTLFEVSKLWYKDNSLMGMV